MRFPQPYSTLERGRDPNSEGCDLPQGAGLACTVNIVVMGHYILVCFLSMLVHTDLTEKPVMPHRKTVIELLLLIRTF